MLELAGTKQKMDLALYTFITIYIYNYDVYNVGEIIWDKSYNHCAR